MRGHIEKNKVDTRDKHSKSAVEVHEDEKENSQEQEDSCILEDDENKMVFFEPFLLPKKKNITAKPDSTKLKRHPLKLKSDRKGSQTSVKVKGKFKPNWDDSCIDLIDNSYNLDSLEDEFRAKRDEIRKRKEENYAKITQDQSTLQTASGSQTVSEDTCSGNDSDSVGNELSYENLRYERNKNVDNFVSSTPTTHDKVTRQRRVNEGKRERRTVRSGSEGDHQFSTPALRVPVDLPCLLSPILSVTEQSSGKNKHGQKKDNVCSSGSLRLSSEKNENQMNMKYWKKMFKKLNPVPVSVEKVTVQPYIHADREDSDTDNSILEATKNYSEKDVEVSPLLQSPDPFEDSDVLHDHLQTSYTEKDHLAKSNSSETQMEKVQDGTEQLNSTCEHVCRYSSSGQNSVLQKTDLSDRLDSVCNSVIDEINQSQNNNESKYISHIESDYMGCIDSQNTSEETRSSSVRNIGFRRRCRSLRSNSKGNRNTSIVVKDSSLPSISEICEISMSSNCSADRIKLDTNENTTEYIEICSQDNYVSMSTPHQEMSRLTLSESRSSCKTIKKKSFAPRRSHVVVPLAQKMCSSFERTSGFREAYLGTPSQRRFMDKNSPTWQLEDRRCSMFKYDDDILSGEEKRDGVTFKDVVLEHCGQTDVLAFDKAFHDSDLADSKKIGEGVYGEVFARSDSHLQPIVMKIMPIEGDIEINGEPQKTFEEILPEIVITMQLSNLRENENFSTPNFPELMNCWCVQGRYHPRLLKLWHEYDEEKISENDSPEILPEDQIYIILELSNVGSALEGFTFNSAEQSWSAFMQVTYTLAVAEASLEFEHRDLHWGNILIKRTTDKTITCKFYGEDQIVPTQGIQASVIDFTLSRITYDGCCIYNNLAEDPALFEGQGDYQFDIYRMMQDETENNWQIFQPYTNVLWLSYVLEKLITGAYYRNDKTKIHKRGRAKLIEMKRHILDFKSATEVALSFS